LGASSRPCCAGEIAQFPAALAGSAPEALSTIAAESSSSQRWAGSKKAGAGKRVSTALPAPLPSLTALQQHDEYIAGVAYRACPIMHRELGWAGNDALGECPREASHIPTSHPASPYLQQSSWEVSLHLNARAQR